MINPGEGSRCNRPIRAARQTPRQSPKAAGAGPPTGLTLSENALVGLYFIQRYRFLTIAQFGHAAGLKPSFSAELLRSLEARGFLGYFGNVGMRGHGKTPKVYYLTRKGYTFPAHTIANRLRDRGTPTPKDKSEQPTSQ